jgi:hypothetical protein
MAVIRDGQPQSNRTITSRLIPLPACACSHVRHPHQQCRLRKYEKVDEASAASWKEILDVNLMSYVGVVRLTYRDQRSPTQDA